MSVSIVARSSKHSNQSTLAKIKVKGKVRPRTGLEGPEGEQRYSSTVSLTSALDGGGPLYPQERTGTHFIGGWVGPRAGLDGCGKSRPNRASIPGPPSP
jgi:hypothetical protein